MRVVTATLLFLTICTFLPAQNYHHVIDTIFTSEPVASYVLPNGNLRTFYVTKSAYRIGSLELSDFNPSGVLVRKKDLIFNPAYFQSGPIPSVFPMRDGSAIVATLNDDCDTATPGFRVLVDTAGNITKNYGFGSTTSHLWYGHILTQIRKDTVALYHNFLPEYYPMVLSTGKWLDLVADPFRQLPPINSYNNTWYTARGSSIFHYDANDNLLRTESMPGEIKQIIQLSTTDLIVGTAEYYFKVDTNFIIRQVAQVQDSLAQIIPLDNGNFLINNYIGSVVPVHNQHLQAIDSLEVQNLIRIRQMTAVGNQIYVFGSATANRSKVAFISSQPVSQKKIGFREHVALDGIQLLDGVRIIRDTTSPYPNAIKAEFNDIKITIRNSGITVLDSVSVCYRLTGCPGWCVPATELVYPIRQLNLHPGQTRQVILHGMKTNCTIDSLNEICLWLRSPNGAVDSNQINNELCISQYALVNTQEIANLEKVGLFPNPAADQVKITGIESVSDEIHFILSDALGVMSRTGTLPASQTIDHLKSLPNGIYTLSLYHSRASVSRLLVVQHD
jgi:hypothetical protein